MQMVAESAGNPKAFSPSGAIGLFQLMPATARELGVDPWDSDDSTKGGCHYMQQKLMQVKGALSPMLLPNTQEDDVYRMALAAYNAGFGYVRNALQAIQRKEKTPDYDTFMWELERVVLRGKSFDINQVRGYVMKILPPVIV